MAGQKREARLRADVPGIRVFLDRCRKGVDRRDKPGHDGESERLGQFLQRGLHGALECGDVAEFVGHVDLAGVGLAGPVDGAQDRAYGAEKSEGPSGIPVVVTGTVRSLDGTPIGGAVLDVWQADEDGAYEAQLAVEEARLRAPAGPAEVLSDSATTLATLAWSRSSGLDVKRQTIVLSSLWRVVPRPRNSMRSTLGMTKPSNTRRSSGSRPRPR